MVLDDVQIADGDQIPRWLGHGRSGIERRNEIEDDRGGNRRRVWKPVEQSLSCPPGDVDDAVDLWDDLPFRPPNSPEYCPAPCDLLLVGPLVRLRDPEVDGQDDPLVRPLPCPQCSSCCRRVLGIDDAVADSGESPPQRVVQEHLVPMPVPDDPSSTTATLDDPSQSEDGHSQGVKPGERRDHRRVHPYPPQVLTELSNMGVYSGDAFFPEHGGDDQRATRPPGGAAASPRLIRGRVVSLLRRASTRHP